MTSSLRIAQIMGKMDTGGVRSVVMNYYRHIDKNKVQFDFICDSDSKDIPKKEIENSGGRVYVVPPYQKITEYIPALIKLFKNNGYKIVHSHINTLSVFPLYAAKKAGVPVRIAHSHSTAAPGEWKRNAMKYTLRPLSKVYATHYAACSEYAGEWLFGKKAVRQGRVTVFNNAVEIDKFRYNETVRDEVRRELGVGGKFVVGHIGRLCYPKNQEFLIDVFERVYKRNGNAVLLLAGDGPDREKIERRIKLSPAAKSIVFPGSRDDPERLYQAMDVFALPSRYEGFPVVAVEAQAAGLPCIVSDRVTEETKISDHIKYLPLTNAELWVKEITAAADLTRVPGGPDKTDPRYDIKSAAGLLAGFYNRCLRQAVLVPKTGE